MTAVCLPRAKSLHARFKQLIYEIFSLRHSQNWTYSGMSFEKFSFNSFLIEIYKTSERKSPRNSFFSWFNFDEIWVKLTQKLIHCNERVDSARSSCHWDETNGKMSSLQFKLYSSSPVMNENAWKFQKH